MSVGRLFTKRHFELISSHCCAVEKYIYIAVAHTCVYHAGITLDHAHAERIRQTLTEH